MHRQVPESTKNLGDYPPKGVGRVGLDAYLKNGYIPGGGQATGSTGPVAEVGHGGLVQSAMLLVHSAS
jgi:hypothetical protein